MILKVWWQRPLVYLPWQQKQQLCWWIDFGSSSLDWYNSWCWATSQGPPSSWLSRSLCDTVTLNTSGIWPSRNVTEKKQILHKLQRHREIIEQTHAQVHPYKHTNCTFSFFTWPIMCNRKHPPTVCRITSGNNICQTLTHKSRIHIGSLCDISESEHELTTVLTVVFTDIRSYLWKTVFSG